MKVEVAEEIHPTTAPGTAAPFGGSPTTITCAACRRLCARELLAPQAVDER
jgi:hypothetical protein